MKKREGMTLIEIMLVVFIIGILTSLCTLAISKARKTAFRKQAEVELSFLSASILQLASDTGTWPNKAILTAPGSTEIWYLDGTGTGLLQNDGTYIGWRGPYYEGTMEDPWGNPYFFDPDYNIGGATRVVVGSFGPNGKGRNLYDSDDLYILLDD
ncbi:MAG: prepilin-type N-terminal cleavage/methylation domain-containing protein [Pontiellaceae bacterium]|nr:prepilin-type N-terminal cleavage/methylation domain-containing protein [Pontiellaceae bacterium]MBN2786159.1 prepilin-type N-terminal cleavage/methylation domain-containing protein [Pontiellaceae bacterium]